MRLWMRKIRVAQGLTLQDIANAAGVSVQSVAYYESGERTPTVPVAKKIANFLGINWTQFVEDKSA